MATTPSAFFQSAAPDALAYALKNIPGGAKKGFKQFHDGASKASKDRFAGTNQNDVFVLGAGDKVAKASKGYDAVITEQSFSIGKLKNVVAVQLKGSSNAKLTGSSGNNNLFGNDGNNMIKGNAGKDVLAGGAGNDKILGGTGRDTLLGGEGDDRLDGGADHDLIMGGAGNDTIKGGGGNGKDKLFGDDGDDKLFGGSGDDVLNGGNGNDTLVGQKGSNKLFGGEGKDTFEIQNQKGELDVIQDFQKGQDIIDLSNTGAKSFGDLKLKANGGDTIVTTKDGTTFKLVGYNPDDVDATFFSF